MQNKYLKKINPIIIIGAPRSGTNILRDTISSFNEVGTWDCDEIPYIWLYGSVLSFLKIAVYKCASLSTFGDGEDFKCFSSHLPLTGF